MSACDVRSGEAGACVKADRAMRDAVAALQRDLASVEVPAAYKDGDTAMKGQLDDLVSALELRDASIAAKDRVGLDRSLKALAQVHLEEAASLYPDGSGITVDPIN